MKKPLVVLSFFVLQLYSLSVTAQKMLTNRQVFDFNAGDVFEYKLSAHPSGNLYAQRYHTILSKKVSAASDTLYYKVKRREYYAIDPQHIYDITDTITLTYYNLDSNAVQPVKVSSGKDSVSITTDKDNNGRVINKYYYATTSKFENTRKIKIYIAGAGQSLNSEETDGNSVSYQELVYYKKGNQTWGTALTTGIPNQSASISDVSVYPNPVVSGHVFHIRNLPIQLSTIKLYDTQGRLVQNIPIQSIYSDVSEIGINATFAVGTYFLQIQNPKELFTYKLLVTP